MLDSSTLFKLILNMAIKNRVGNTHSFSDLPEHLQIPKFRSVGTMVVVCLVDHTITDLIAALIIFQVVLWRRKS